MNTRLTLPSRWLCLLLMFAVGLYCVFPLVQRSTWHKNRLYARLLNGNSDQQLMAASALAYLGAQEQLLQALQAQNSSARELGQRALEHLWFTAAGDEAYQVMQKAFRLEQDNQAPQALGLLHQLVRKYPRYAEAWNRRASAYWQMGEYEKSMADSERALALNPCHYGAWQGLGMGHLQKGNLSEACRCLRAALKIIPYDTATRDALHKCEDLLRSYPQPSQQKRPLDIV